MSWNVCHPAPQPSPRSTGQREFLIKPLATAMNLTVLIILLAACAVFFVLEWRGVRTTLALEFKGDIKRESRWLAQYGQSVCTPVAALLVGTMDPAARLKPFMLIAAVLSTSIACMLVKRLLGRVRPGRENAGKFLGPALRH